VTWGIDGFHVVDMIPLEGRSNTEYFLLHGGCPTSGVAQRAMREAAPHARGVSKARQL
jgi:hypothetical protein